MLFPEISAAARDTSTLSKQFSPQSVERKANLDSTAVAKDPFLVRRAHHERMRIKLKAISKPFVLSRVSKGERSL